MAKSVQESLEATGTLYERIVYECETAEAGGTDVYFYLMPPPGMAVDSDRRWLLMNVVETEITIYPFAFTATAYESKYGAMQRIIIPSSPLRPYREPKEHEDVERIIDDLPDWLEKNPLRGLGFATSDRFIPLAIASMGKDMSIIVAGDSPTPYLESNLYVVSPTYIKQLVSGMRSIATRYQRQARTDKQLLAHNSLLSSVDSNRFPPKKKHIDAEAVFELVSVGKIGTKLSKNSQLNVVKLLDQNIQEIAEKSPQTLYDLAATIERVTLDQLIIKYESMLSKSLDEKKWQDFFESNTFILSLAFSVPAVYVKNTPYVSGKRVDGKGGKFSDFLMRCQSTGNVALVEIKTPKSKLLSSYRDEQPGPSSELTGAITQILGQRRKLMTNWHALKGEDDGTLDGAELYSPQMIVLIGVIPPTKFDREAFELYRNILKDISVITFDELLSRLKYLRDVLSTDETWTS